MNPLSHPRFPFVSLRLMRVALSARRLASFFLLLLALSTYGHAQTAQISGRIVDATGAVLPNAVVTMTNVDTKVSRLTETNQSGNYNLTLLPPGNYSLLAAKAGFSSVTEQHIVLNVDQSMSLEVTLAIGSVSETVEVSSNAELLQATTSDLGTVIDERAVHDLPLNGRNFTQLLTLTPGATPVSVSQGANTGTDDGSAVALPGSSYSNPSINGQQNRSTLFLYDGVVNTDFRTSVYTVLPIIDAVAEFKIVSHNDDPAYGSVLGGVVNLVSKSGTNRLHGSAWEFLRNDFFDARNSFLDVDRKSPQPFRQNEFGVTVGGPVRIPKLYDGRDKTFFFFAYEGWRYRSPPGGRYYSPTAAELNGDFSHSILLGGPKTPYAGQPKPIFDPNTTAQTSPGNFTRTQFSYNGMANVINPSRINTQVQTYLKTYLDKPNAPDNGNGNTTNNATLINNLNDYHGRVDERLTGRDTLFFRWSTMGVNLTSPSTNVIASGSIFKGLNFGGGYTHIFSPKLIFDVRGGRATRPFTFDTINSAGDGGLAGFTTLGAFGPPGFNLGSFYRGAGLGAPALRRNSSGSVTSSLTYQAGNHTLTGGGGFIKQYRSQSGNGQGYTFDPFQTGLPSSNTAIVDGTGNDLASALLGLPSQGQFNAHNVIRYSYLSWFGFVSDSWKVSPKLTVNYGLRFDHLDQPTLESGINNGFNFATGNYELGGGKLPGACITTNASPCIPGSSTNVNTDLAAVPGVDGSAAGSHIVVTSNALRGPQPEWKNYGPRMGFAYKATNETVVRAGFGVVFDDLSGISQTFSNSINSWPSNGTSNPHFNSTFDAPQTTVAQSQGSITGGLPSATPFNQGGFFYDPKMKIAYSEQYNLGIDTTVAPHYLLSASYVGAVSRRLDYGGIANGNRTYNVDSSRPFPYMTYLFWDQSTASSNYNALQVKFERQMTRGLQFLLAYTWSKSIDDASGRFGLAEEGPGGGSAIQNFYDPRSNRAVSAYDIPHFVSFASLYELPFGKGKPYLNSGLASYLVGGWQLSNLAQIRSGQPYTLQVDGDIAGLGGGASGYGRPNPISGVSQKPNHSTRTMWFNPAAFSTPFQSYGTVSRNSMRSANVVNDDFSVFKNFVYKEGISMQFRAEAFNVLNIVNYAAPNSDISSSNAGVVGGQVLPPRQLQFALKLNF